MVDVKEIINEELFNNDFPEIKKLDGIICHNKKNTNKSFSLFCNMGVVKTYFLGICDYCKTVKIMQYEADDIYQFYKKFCTTEEVDNLYSYVLVQRYRNYYNIEISGQNHKGMFIDVLIPKDVGLFGVILPGKDISLRLNIVGDLNYEVGNDCSDGVNVYESINIKMEYDGSEILSNDRMIKLRKPIMLGSVTKYVDFGFMKIYFFDDVNKNKILSMFVGKEMMSVDEIKNKVYGVECIVVMKSSTHLYFISNVSKYDNVLCVFKSDKQYQYFPLNGFVFYKYGEFYTELKYEKHYRILMLLDIEHEYKILSKTSYIDTLNEFVDDSGLCDKCEYIEITFNDDMYYDIIHGDLLDSLKIIDLIRSNKKVLYYFEIKYRNLSKLDRYEKKYPELKYFYDRVVDLEIREKNYELIGTINYELFEKKEQEKLIVKNNNILKDTVDNSIMGSVIGILDNVGISSYLQYYIPQYKNFYS